MADYYIDPATAAGGSGSSASPFNSISSLPTRNPGDNVYFKAGTTTVGQLTHTPANATSTALSTPVVYGRYGAGPAPAVRSNAWCVDISQPGAVVQDLQFGAASSYSSGGVRALNCGEVRTQRCTFEDTCDYGIRYDNTSAGLYRNLEALDNVVQGTYLNAGILVIWGSQIGGVYEDVLISGNTISRPGARSTDYSNGPMGIRCIPRADAMTTDNGATELNLFSRGVIVERNVITDTPSFGIAYSGVSSGGTSTKQNRVAGNVLRNNGNGFYDSHVVWVACARDVFVGHNTIDGSVMYQGGASGTGVGIFIDNSSFTQLYNNSKRIKVRGNIIHSTGKLPDGSPGGLEVKGCGILAYLSQDLDIVGNKTYDCFNGIGVLGWFGSGAKSANILIKGNESYRSLRDGITIVKAPDAVTAQENYVDGYGAAGVYVENAGSYAATNYTETRNNVSGVAATAYMGGSEPSSTTTPRAQRLPAAGNLVLDPARY